MRHRRVLTSFVALSLLFAAGLAAAGCGTDDDPGAAPTPGGGVSATAGLGAAGNPIPGATAGPGPTAGPGGPTAGTTVEPGGTAKPGSAPGAQLNASGFGPYQVSAPRKDLAAAGLLGKVKTSSGCPDYVVATGLKRYQSPSLVFYQGKLQYTAVSSAKTGTSAGARVGMKLAEVKKKHPSGKQLTDWNGAIAWFAATGSNALLFRFKNNKVTAIEAGIGETLQFRFTDGEGC